MFAAVDPIPMVQLMNLIGREYVVWDKSATIDFRRPAREDLYADFRYQPADIQELIRKVNERQEIEMVKTTQLTNMDGTVVFCEVRKTIYIADKAYFKQKRNAKLSS